MRAANKRLADHLLGQRVEEWIRARQAEGRSIRRIPEDLANATDGAVDVSHSTLINWLRDDEQYVVPAQKSPSHS